MNNPEVETAVETSETAPLMGDDVETREINAENRPTNEHYKSSQWWNRIKYYIPILSWLPNYSFNDLKFDIIAGITISFILIPQGLSYAANLIKINPIYGLYSCIIPALIYVLLGTSRQISIGPEAVISIMTGSTISEYIRRNSEEFADISDQDMSTNRAELAFLITAIVGILTLIFGLFRLGFLDSVLSRALLSGFTSAVATVILFEQIPLLLGISSNYETTSPIEKFVYIMKNNFGEFHKETLMVSVLSLLFLLVVSILKKTRKETFIQRFPEILFLVVTCIICSAYFDWEGKKIKVLGDIDSNVEIKYPIFNIKRLNGLFVPSILIAVVGFVEALIITKKYSSKYKYSVSPNRELVAFGSLNIVGSFFGATPTYASLSRSRINDMAGAKSQISGITSVGVIFLTIKYLLPYFKYLPTPCMAAIISVAALGLIEVNDIIYFFKAKSYSDILLMMLIYFTTIFFSISDGILISVSLSLLLVVKHTTVPRLKVLGKYKIIDEKTGEEKFKFKNVKKHNTHRYNILDRINGDDNESLEKEDTCEVEQIEGVIIIKIGDSLFFGNTGQLKERFRRIEVYRQTGIHPGEDPHLIDPDYENHPIQEIILDFENVGTIDACATQILSEIIEDYHQRNIGVSIIKLNESCKKQFKNSGLYEKIEFHRYFNKISDCLDALTYYVPGLPNGVNWKDSEGIVYPRANNIVHDGTSISWDPIDNIWNEPFNLLDENINANKNEENFIRYRIHRQSTAATFTSTNQGQIKGHNVSIDQYAEPLPKNIVNNIL
ncbi:sulfate permease [Neocallimastix lanati (nom. inval.)]|uniref:Sulfate permease n=1 Tax=Neocallimastix californiae TaxID=1754190 RepID=A0A1Y2AEX7_9FUNG|nr:sulfate permease [Neocallimastix sp. JGI-2020a]ORY21121.1 sulfate permease [Neocallimastix californiae]|eukprot:ORY21121.1 sulfate permease [Neocallimastix californiae]